jgi:diguanylate cyclase (GGDEF)-like protein
MNQAASQRAGRILVVDDDTINLRVLVDLLRNDYHITAAKDGTRALNILEHSGELPDLVILDIVMPDIDGYAVCRRIKHNPRTADLPVIFVSSRAEVDDEVNGFTVGGIDYITKPFNETVVRARVRTHMELKRRGDLLAQLSILDGLTKLHNRRRFDEILAYEWSRSLRSPHPLALILMDIDHFKLYNDHYGHAAGDECIKTVAHTIGSCMKRPVDFVGRYGGEEFVCLLPETDWAGARAVAERIRQAIVDLQYPHVASTVAPHVTLSLGLAVLTPTHGMSPGRLIETADEALYASKRAGRNRITEFRTELHTAPAA